MSTMRAVCAALALYASFACQPSAQSQSAGSPPIVQPGRPGEPSRTISADEASDLSQVGVTPADVQFMKDMLSHHAQALEMTALLRTRTERDDMRRLAERIDISQSDEIGMMRDWLAAHGAEADAGHAHHEHAGALMPGMLTPEQMQRLADARGALFDRLFLEGMIAHHRGALAMVASLFGTPGAGQESSVFEFASDVESDQQMEIVRMGTMLEALSR